MFVLIFYKVYVTLYLELLNSLGTNQQHDANYYLDKIKHRLSFKLYILKLLKKGDTATIRKNHFTISDPLYDSTKVNTFNPLGSFCKYNNQIGTQRIFISYALQALELFPFLGSYSYC